MVILPSNFGNMKLQDDESSYTESNHWTAILHEISDFKNLFRDSEGPTNSDARVEQKTHPGLGLFLDQPTTVTKVDILSVIPPRPIVDGLIAKYFSSADMPVTLIIHRNVFFRQYESFWERPLETPIMWVTILFGMMFTTAYITLYIAKDIASLDETTLVAYNNVVAIAKEKMIQCLQLGNYMKGAPHTIEALLSLVIIEYLQGDHAQYGCWQLIGVTIRVALRMGYHRDGSHFSNVSAYEAEMRRRAWYILIQFDIASAAQVGLPRIIKEAQCDTMEPSSLLDDDFDESTKALPPARPNKEHTLAQFLIYKSRVVAVYGRICDFTTSSEQRDYDEVMRLDAQLNSAFTQKPAVLEPKSMQRSILDGAQLIARRLYIAMAYHHAQMTLHRKFLISGKTDSRYAYSYTTCTAAALSALVYQKGLFEQCQPGHSMHADRWKVVSLTQSEFLLATTVLCLALDNELMHPQPGPSPLRSDVRKFIEKLQTSQAVWTSQMDLSKEAQTAVKAIDIVLRKVPSASSHDVTGLNSVSPINTMHGFSISDYQQPFPQHNTTLDDTFANVHATADDMNRNELFDLDISWDSWVQL
ncbi:hypothetical protein N0V95_005038 [Ascochyta clinopodiicola]|nr:hypothetical protein N0V95_005038 [Ascochyta clinopodiicola]